MRVGVCVDCPAGNSFEVTGLKGRVPLRCPEHRRLHLNRLHVGYAAKRKLHYLESGEELELKEESQ